MIGTIRCMVLLFLSRCNNVWFTLPMSVSLRAQCLFFFFFQAEDGIRDYKVTGVQTCALPISARRDDGFTAAVVGGMGGSSLAPDVLNRTFGSGDGWLAVRVLDSTDPEAVAARSEERRVGKEGRSPWAPDH